MSNEETRAAVMGLPDTDEALMYCLERHGDIEEYQPIRLDSLKSLITDLEAEAKLEALAHEKWASWSSYTAELLGCEPSQMAVEKAIAELRKVASQVHHCENCGGSYYDDGLVNTQCPCQTNTDLENQVAQYREALADAIRRPMGVCPDSTQGLLTPDEMDAAEVRRSRQYGGTR